MAMIPVLRPSYTDAEAQAVAQVLRSGWSGLGPRVEEFEHSFAEHLGVRHAIATSSCTAALQIALRLVGVRDSGCVLVPSLTFVSSAHAIAYNSAQPIFMDIDRESLCSLDAQAEEVLRRKHYGNIDAIVSVLYAGQPLGISSTKYPVVYDCAHACGSTFDARDKLCCWSFHAVKNLSCGEGGMLTTDDSTIADRARRLRWMGIDTSTYERNYFGVGYSERPRYKWEYGCNEIGFKANMSDIQAAIGLVQLQRLPEMQQKRIVLASAYWQHLRGLEDFILPLTHWEGSSYHLFVTRCKFRDRLHQFLADRQISTGVHYKPIHLYKCYGYQTPLPVAEEEWTKLLTLPLYPDLTLDQVARICDAIRNFYVGDPCA